MAQKIDINTYIGQKFGKLTVTQIWENAQKQEIKCKALCDECGHEKEFNFRDLKSKRIKTCGCKHQKANLEDLIGQTFNRLTIINAVREKRGKDSHEQVYVTCKCECGNTIQARLSVLKNETIKSCGCLHKETVSKDWTKAIGQKFGKLTVIDIKKEGYEVIAICKCDCGNIKRMRYRALKKNANPSCGCDKKAAAKYNLDDLIGQKYSQLTIKSAIRNERSELYVDAECECGNVIHTRYRNLTTGHTKTCGKCKMIDLSTLIGQKFGKLTVINAYRNKEKIMVKAICDCGTEKEDILLLADVRKQQLMVNQKLDYIKFGEK